jgi:excisionase family DNA binding protein
VLVPRPLPPERVRSTDLDDRNLGLADGESVVFHRPDGPWIGLASLGDGATLRTEGPQRGIVLDRLGRQLGPDAAPTKHLCLRCGLILDPVILGHHTTSREHRAHKDPWLEPAVQREAARAATVEPEPRAPDVRSSVTMEPLLISVADAARILGLSRSMIGELALKGIIPSLRVGSRVLVLVKALEEWIEARLAEDAERFAASWSRLRSHVTPARSLSNGRGAPQRRRPRWLHSAEIVSVCPDPAIQ